jgi:hypothetical protein
MVILSIGLRVMMPYRQKKAHAHVLTSHRFTVVAREDYHYNVKALIFFFFEILKPLSLVRRKLVCGYHNQVTDNVIRILQSVV